MRAAVIGGGIGGLCTAVGLRRAGAAVTVYERSADLRPGGSGLSVFGNGLRALDSLGLGDGFRAITSADAGLLRGGQRRPDGRWLATFPPESLTELRVVDRAQLHELLSSALAPGALRPGRRVIAATAEGRVTHVGADGVADEDAFDVVVAADGLNSVVRQSLPEDPGIAYSGYSTWRGITDGPVDLHGEAGETWGVGRRFGMTPNFGQGGGQAIAARSRAVGRLAHVRGRTLAGLRDLVVRATPASALRRQLARIQAWSPPA